MKLPTGTKQLFDNLGYWIDERGTVYSGVYKKAGGYKGETYINSDDVHTLKQHLVKGYYQFLVRGKNYKTRRVLKMIFDPIENPKKYLVCHKDGNPLNNKLDNLYWGDQKSNALDRKEHGHDPVGFNSARAVFDTNGINLVYSMYFNQKLTMDEISNRTGKSRATISRVLNGWTYKEETKRLCKRKPHTYQTVRLLKMKKKIRALHKKGASYQSIANTYGFGKNQIWRLCNNLSYQKKFIT